MDVTIVITAREVFSTTLASLQSILRNTPSSIKIIFIASGFPQKITNKIENISKNRNILMVYKDHFLTPNQARNLALDNVDTRYVVFIDNDVVVAENWLEPLVICAEEEQATLVSPLLFEHNPPLRYIHMAGGECQILINDEGERVYHEKHCLQHHDNVKDPQYLKRHTTELIEFHTVLIDAVYLKKIGGLDEQLLSLSEHWDLCINVLKDSGKIFIEPESRVTYIPPKKTTSDDLSFFNLRWSEEWFEASEKRLINKHGLNPKLGSFVPARWFLINHRLHKYTKYRKNLSSLFGARVGNKLLRMTFGFWDRAINGFVIRNNYQRWLKYTNERKL